MKVESIDKTLEVILGCLLADDPFTYTRFSDGQLLHMGGWEGDKLDHRGSSILRLLQKRAIQVNNPSYLIGMPLNNKVEKHMRGNTFGKFKNEDKMLEILKGVLPDWSSRQFYSCCAVQYAMLYKHEMIRDIFKVINEHKVTIVGGGHLVKAMSFFPDATWVETVRVDAFDEVDEILEHIYKSKPEIVLTSCGLAAQPIQYFMFKDTKITTLNFGSIFDALLKLQTRGWIVDNPTKLYEA